MFQRFTDHARKVMALANQEAQHYHHEYIGTEHILLGLVKEGSGVGATVLKNLDVDLKKLRIEMEKLIKSRADAVVMGKLPQTPRAKKVIEYAMEECRALNHNYVGTEHILLGLMRETEAIAAQVLMNLGLTLEDVRQEVLQLLGVGIEKTDVEKDSSYQGPFAEGDDFREDDLRKDFVRFLTEEKKWLEISVANENYKTMSIDLSIRHPESKKLIGLINFKKGIDRKIESKANASFTQFAELEIGKILVTPSIEKSNYSFAIYKYSDRGLVRMQPNDFPAYEKREPKIPDKKLTLSNFKIGLLFDELEICDKVIAIAVRLNGLEHYVAHESYVNLELKNKNSVVAQLHRYGENEKKIALAVVGCRKGVEVSEPELTGFVTKGEIAKSSGYKKGPPGERAWLNGNRPKTGAGEKASVYVIEREILEYPNAWDDVNKLLKLAKENVQGRGPISEAEELGSYHAPIAAFSGDGVRDAEGRLVDQLGIKPEVNAMSSLIAARDIKWPLSIGLFGDWGRGKSFFMEMMYDRVKKISNESEKWVERGNESDYCRNVVQIRFNAWHYMDSNLWASLVTHIFDELAKEVSSREKVDVEETRKVLFENLESAKKLKDEAEEHEKKAADLRQNAESKLTKVEKERADAEKELKHITARDVLALAKADPRIQEQFQQIADKLGLAGIGAEAENIRDVVTETNQVFGRVILIRKRIAAQKNGKFKLIGLTMLLMVLPVLVGLVIFKVLPSGWIEQLGGMVFGCVTFLGIHAKTLRPKLKQISKGLAQWEKTQEQIVNIGNETTRAEIELREEIKALKEQENRARQEVEDAEKRVQRAKEELDEIRTGRRLQRLIEEGSRKSEYLDKLGIIAVIRKDFEDLKNLVSESSEQVTSGELPRIDRIVLYVDDLDRCPSQRVVEVLQAIHLILGFELFVVVVAVDSRWILNALHEEYSAFGGVDKVNARLGSRWLTTPQNYVEKIFQIPFALRPMGDRGYRQLVGELVESEGRKDGETMGKEQDVTAREGKEKQELEREIPQREEKEIRMDEFEPTIEMEPPSANLNEQEAEFMKAMGDLIPSPRAAKRFVNIYRLTLASVDDRGKLSELRGTENRPGDYQAVLLMLAILTGFPGQGADILKTLANGGGKSGGIMDFVSKLKTRKEPNSEPARYSNGVRKGILEAERAVWDRLSSILKERIEELGVRDSLEPFVRWAGWVARFSFQYKPVISEEEGGEEDG